MSAGTAPARCIAVLLVYVLSSVSALSAPAGEGTDAGDGPAGGYLTFYLDNDLFGGTDRNYTNGVRLSWVSEGQPLLDVPPLRQQLEKLAGADADYRLVRAVSGLDEANVASGTVELNYGLSLTQLMFTPADPFSTVQPPGQRRYAGWLGLGFSVHAKDPGALNSAELILGTVGPRSLAREAQDFVHDLRGIYRFEAWHEQIPNEWTVDLALDQKRRLRLVEATGSGLMVDGFTEWGVRLGSFRTQASAGGFLRVGFNLPADFSDPRLSSTAYSHRFFAGPEGPNGKLSAYALLGADAYAVAFDASLDGPLFGNFETGNDRSPLYGDLFLGFGLRWHDVEFSYVHSWRSRSFEQESGYTDFGSAALRLRL
jgi:hypothetical protein